ncbi:MAG: Zn-dependent alcohol dehydrogenase [Chloroflexota bacterium]|nr:Zn-dependent alcohol dehydrogenase [Chloroflexota bacterium]
MKAAVLYKAGTPLVIEDLKQDSPKAKEVKVKVRCVGVCHSDLHYMKGDAVLPLPVVLGHEMSGVVTEVGPNVTEHKIGDHVIGNFRPSCGACRYCAGGMPYMCERYYALRGPLTDGTTRLHKDGKDVWVMGMMGAFAEYCVVPESGAIPMPKEMPFGPACLIGCAVTTGVGAVVNRAKVRPGASVVVIGIGGVGLNVVQGARLVSATRIIAVDILDNKLEMARQFGATHTINASKEDVVKRVKELTEGLGSDYAFEVIGNPKALRQAFDCLRPSGTAVMVGAPPIGSEVTVEARPFMFAEKILMGTWYGSSRPRIDFPRMVDLYMTKKLKIDELISRTYKLEQINEAFAALERGEVARSIITFD